MRYSVKTRSQIHVKDYGFLSFAKKWAVAWKKAWAVIMGESFLT